MTGTEHLVRLQRHADAAGAKVIYQGDALQLQPIAAGGGFRALEEAVGAVELKDIRRQKTDRGREIANAMYGDGGKPGEGERDYSERSELGADIWRRLQDNHHVVEMGTRKAAMDQLVKDYFNAPGPASEKLIIADTRAAVQQLNDAVRSEKQKRGEVGGDLVTVEMSIRGQKQKTTLGEGDEVLFTKKDKHLGVVNGDVGIVLAAKPVDGKPGWADISMRMTEGEQAGKTLRFLTNGDKDQPVITHAYALTVHKSQGQGRNHVFQYVSSAGMSDQHLGLVAYTRHKETFKLYGSANDLETLHVRFGTDRLKRNASEAGLHDQAAAQRERQRSSTMSEALERLQKMPGVRQVIEQMDRWKQRPQPEIPMHQEPRRSQRI